MAHSDQSGILSGNRIINHPVHGELAPAKTIAITVDDVSLEAREGEPIAAALLANGIHVFRTMPGTDAPRGPFCAVGRCPDCLMTVDGMLNVRTCVTPVRDGMHILTQRGLGEWEQGDK